jgi:serine protease Do
MKKISYVTGLVFCIGITFASFAYSQSGQQIPNQKYPGSFADLVEKVGPSVVNIRTTEKVSGQQPDIFGQMPEDQAEAFRHFFGFPIPSPQQKPQQPQKEIQNAVGSGFIISEDGLILTNAHVINGADKIIVTLTDKKEFRATVLGLDKRTDIAVLKIEKTGLPPIILGSSKSIRVGDWVLAIGSPFGLDNTVTAGIVSSKSRDTGEYTPFIQTDVAVNPGNSGGPLINMLGEVVGINSQIFSKSGGYMGISFAIPIDEAMKIADQIRKTGRIKRGKIGVAISPLNEEVAQSLALDSPKGAYVNKVDPGSPAEIGGIIPGDVILKFNDKDIEKASDLPRVVGEVAPGNKVLVDVWRKGAKKTISLTVVDSETDPKQLSSNKTEVNPNAGYKTSLGVVVKDISDNKKRELNIQDGVEVVELRNKQLQMAGLKIGDVIVRLGDKDIKDTQQFELVAKSLDKNKSIPVFIRRQDMTSIIVLKPQ